MSRYDIGKDKFSRLEIVFDEILRKAAKGVYREHDEGVPFLYRALVVAVDVVGGMLENPDGSGRVSHTIDGKKFEAQARVGPKNPPNSIKARVISDGMDKFSTDENVRVFWPFFPENISVPVKPGEHVYVMFEDTHFQHGLWTSRVSGHVGTNYSPGEDWYRPSNESVLVQKFDDTRNVSGEEKKFDKDSDSAETKSGKDLVSLFPGS